MADTEVSNPTFHGRETIRLPARRELFQTLRDRLGRIAETLGASEKIKNQILLAADEIFTNICSYAYPADRASADEETIDIETVFDGSCLQMTFSDSGAPFDPLETSPPELDAKAEDRPVGGLGIHLVRNLMDSTEYRRENDRNVLVLRKRLSLISNTPVCGMPKADLTGTPGNQPGMEHSDESLPIHCPKEKTT